MKWSEASVDYKLWYIVDMKPKVRASLYDWIDNRSLDWDMYLMGGEL